MVGNPNTVELGTLPAGATINQVQVVADGPFNTEARIDYTTPEGEDLQLRQRVDLNFTDTQDTGEALTVDTLREALAALHEEPLREALAALHEERLERPWRWDTITPVEPEEGWPEPLVITNQTTVRRYICGNGHIYPGMGLRFTWPGHDQPFCAQCVGEFLTEQIPHAIQQFHDEVPWDVAYPPPPPDELYTDDEEVTGNTTTTGIGGTTYFEAHYDEPLIGGINGLREE